ncbi:hypothetical protein ACFQU7_37900 [Pseudoroseomonas wenyumeiae]
MTPLDDLLAELAARGLRLAAEGGQLRVRGPRGAVDDALRQRLMAAKDALLAYLERDAITEDALPRVVPDPARRHEPFPLTDIQEAYWVGSGLEGGGGYHYYLEFDVPGLDVARLERAWGALVLRHEMLRAVVMPDGRQRILPEVPAPASAATTCPAWPGTRPRSGRPRCGGRCRTPTARWTGGRCRRCMSACGPAGWGGCMSAWG